MVYAEFTSIVRDMRDLYVCVVEEMYPNRGKQLAGIEHLFKEYGTLF